MMRIDIEGDDSTSSIQEVYIDASILLRYLIGDDEQLETLVMCNPANQFFVTTDQDLYNALGSLKDYDAFKLPKLVKFLEHTTVRPAKARTILKEDWVEKIRKEALKNISADGDMKKDERD